MDSVAERALRYWDGSFPWGSPEVLVSLRESASSVDRAAAAEIERVMERLYEWLEKSSPVDWKSPFVGGRRWASVGR